MCPYDQRQAVAVDVSSRAHSTEAGRRPDYGDATDKVKDRPQAKKTHRQVTHSRKDLYAEYIPFSHDSIARQTTPVKDGQELKRHVTQARQTNSHQAPETTSAAIREIEWSHHKLPLHRQQDAPIREDNARGGRSRLCGS